MIAKLISSENSQLSNSSVWNSKSTLVSQSKGTGSIKYTSHSIYYENSNEYSAFMDNVDQQGWGILTWKNLRKKNTITKIFPNPTPTDSIILNSCRRFLRPLVSLNACTDCLKVAFVTSAETQKNRWYCFVMVCL